MAKIKKKIDLSKKMGTFEPMPKGDYPSQITVSEWKDTDNGRMLSLTWEVLSGEFKGRRFFVNLNLENSSDQAEDMAAREFSSIHEACGKSKTVEDSEDLHKIPCIVGLKIQQPKPGTNYDPRNVATKYEPFKKGKKKDKEGNSKDSSTPPWEKESKKKDKNKKKKK